MGTGGREQSGCGAGASLSRGGGPEAAGKPQVPEDGPPGAGAGRMHEVGGLCGLKMQDLKSKLTPGSKVLGALSLAWIHVGVPLLETS